MSAARGTLTCLLLGAALAGCSGAIYSSHDFRTGQPPRYSREAMPPGVLAAPGSAGFGAIAPGSAGFGAIAPGSAGFGAIASASAGSPAVAQHDVPRTKAQVLATLGPPGEVLPLATGDLFVYRVRRIDGDVININPSIFTGIAVPIYARVEGGRRDDVLFVRFDTAGRVLSVSESRP